MTQKDFLREENERLQNDNRNGIFHLYQDWVFHYVFGQNTRESNLALISILNMILSRENDPISEIRILNPINYRDSLDGKDTTLDIKASTASGEIIDIEMQNGNLRYYEQRSIYYGGKPINSSLENGQKYDKMDKSIVISFINGRIFHDVNQVHTVFQLREKDCGRLLCDRLEIHFIELDKVTVGTDADSLSPSDQLAVYLKYRGDARYDDRIQKLITTGGDRFQMVEKVFREITDDNSIREMYWRKEIYDHDQATLRFIAEEEGLEKGLEQGEARMSALILKLSSLKRGEDIVRAASDSEFRQQLFEEFNIK